MGGNKIVAGNKTVAGRRSAALRMTGSDVARHTSEVDRLTRTSGRLACHP